MRILHPDRPMTPKVARAILDLSFPEADVARMRDLSARACAGTLTPEEGVLMDDIERAGSLLFILKSKARQVLNRPKRSA